MDADDFDNGWDTSARLVDGGWVERTPRRPEVEPWMRRELTLLPWLSARLPLPIPRPALVSRQPLVVRHPYLSGGACPGTSARHGAQVGVMLRVLHDIDAEEAAAHGALDAASAHRQLRDVLDQMTERVLPMLPPELYDAGAALLDRIGTEPSQTSLIHADLGPGHILVTGDDVTGVIDWLDARIGDPALDLAWTIEGAKKGFAEAVREAYQPTDAVLERAHDWHLLGPWHEVIYGIATNQTAFVESGLAGTVTRLRSS